MKDLVKKAGLESEFLIASAATSSEEVGNGVHYGTRRVLDSLGISCEGKRAVKMNKGDYDKYDYIIGMEQANIRNILRITGGDDENKVSKLLDFAGEDKDIADPWYTGNFNETYSDVVRGCEALLKKICKK